MIYLIGGPPRSGKTTLAKRLAARLRIGWVPVDILESIVREYTPKDNRKKLFPKNLFRKAINGSNDKMYQTFSAPEITDAYIRQGKTSWQAVEIFVSNCIQDAHDFIIEGYQIHPHLVMKLTKKFPHEIRSVFLIKKNVSALMEGFHKSKAKHDWVLQKTMKVETFAKIAEMLSYFGERVERDAAQHRLRVYCMDKNFLKLIAALEKELGRS